MTNDENMKFPDSFDINPFLPPENTRKPLVFWCFLGVQNGNTGQKWVKMAVLVTKILPQEMFQY